MICPHCSTANPDGVSRCQRCSAPLTDSGASRPIPPDDTEHDTPPGGLSATGSDPDAGSAADPRAGSGGYASGPVEGSEDMTMDGSRSTGRLQGRTEMGAGGPRTSSPTGTDSSSGGRRPSSSGMGTAGERGRLTATDLAVLPEGFEIGHRYRVARVVGRGGMGAVYRVHDLELDRDVALKIIRPDISDNLTTLDRFKREIMLSSKVTHKNVLRVYDLGEADGLRFVTMQFVEGEDLAHLIRREGKLPLERIVDIFKQTCRGLAAAHEQGVVHRDLKPQNIMLDGAGTVFLTDFGLAKSLGDTGFTETGMLMGTPHYMSPEQVRAEQVDARSDIYSLGVILYELCTGKLPFSGGSAFEVMMRRLQKPPKPIAEINPEVPVYLRKILDKCLAVELKDRYQSIGEVLDDLEAEGQAARGAAGTRPTKMPWWVVATAVAALAAVVVAGVWWVRTRPEVPPVAQAPRSVLIADFDNTTGDPVFDGTLEPALSVALEGAPFITSFSRPTARRLAAQLQPNAARIDEALARLIAGREGIEIVTGGSIGKKGSGYALSISVIDALTGKPLLEETASVDGKEAVLSSVTRLAARVRTALGDTTPESTQIAAGETFTAASLEAAHEYGLGMEAQYSGRWDEAVSRYLKALEFDPNLGRAYAGLAAIESNRGRHREAEKYFKDAMAHIDRMSEREKRRTRGAYFLGVSRDPDKAIEEYSALVRNFPADTAGLANLAVAYQLKRDFPKALEFGRRAIQIYPKNVPQRNNVGLFAMYAGDFETAIREQKAVLEQNASFASGYQGLALAQLANGQRDEAIATWRKLEALSPDGASRAALGIADLALYEGRPAEAQATLEKAIDGDLAAHDDDSAARKLTVLGEAFIAQRQPAKAVAAADRARALASEDLVVAFGAARVLAEAGDGRKALDVADALDQKLSPEAHMYAEHLRGLVALSKKSYRDAIQRFSESLKATDFWPTRLALGRAYLGAEAYTEAHAEIDASLRRRGEATDIYLDVVPTYRLFPPVQYYLGRVREGLGSSGAPDAYRAYLEIKARADEQDALAADARKRLGTR